MRKIIRALISTYFIGLNILFKKALKANFKSLEINPARIYNKISLVNNMLRLNSNIKY